MMMMFIFSTVHDFDDNQDYAAFSRGMELMTIKPPLIMILILSMIIMT